VDVGFGTLALSGIVLATCAIGWSAALYERRKLDRYLAEKRRLAAQATPAE
jgi:hypothetical protein